VIHFIALVTVPPMKQNYKVIVPMMTLPSCLLQEDQLELSRYRDSEIYNASVLQLQFIKLHQRSVLCLAGSLVRLSKSVNLID
jgi:hypothetical protein